MFVTSTERDATSADIETYNSFVRTRAKAGHSEITDGCGNRFTVLGSTATVNVRANTGTGSSDTDASIYWLKGAKVADNYADLYDGSWDSKAATLETGGSFPKSGHGVPDYVLTGSNNDGTHHSAWALGSSSGLVRWGNIGGFGSSKPIRHTESGTTTEKPFYGLSPVFKVGPVLSVSLGSSSGNEGATGSSYVNVDIELSSTRSARTEFLLCVKDTGTATFRSASGGKAADFDLVHFGNDQGLTMNADNCHAYGISADFDSSSVRLRIFGDSVPEGSETAVLELRRRSVTPDDVVISPTAASATYTIDNDDGSAPTITVSGGAAVTEGTGAQFTVKASPAPSVNLTVQLDVSDDDTSDFVAPADEGRKTVTIQANRTSATFTVDTTADSTDEPDGSVTVRVEAGEGYTVGGTSSATVTVKDNDTRALVLTPPSKLSVKEGGKSTYTVRLATRPTAAVTVRVSSSAAGVTVDTGGETDDDQNTLTFNPSGAELWSTPQTVTVRAAHDDDGSDESVLLRHFVSGGDYGTSQDTKLRVSVKDDDPVELDISKGALTVVEGDSGDYRVRLATEPTATVTVAITSNNPGVTVNPTSLSFNAAGATNLWSEAQRVTVSAGEDDDAGHYSATLSLSASGGDYEGKAGAVEVAVTDNDTRGLSLSPDALRMPEASSLFYTVRLATEPTGTVTVAIVSDDPDVTVSPASLTFEASGGTELWSTEQMVTVAAAEDDDGVSETVTLTHSPSGGDYGSSENVGLPISVTDDDPRGVLLSTTKVFVSEDGSSTYTARLLTEPTGTVTVAIASDNPDVTVSPASLTFNPSGGSAWNTDQTVTVSAGTDDDRQNERATLTHTTRGGDYGNQPLSGTVEAIVSEAQPLRQPNMPRINILRYGKYVPGQRPAGAHIPVIEGTAASFTVIASSDWQPDGPVTITVLVSEDESEGQDFVAPGDEQLQTVILHPWRDGLAKLYQVPTVNDAANEPNGAVTVKVMPGVDYIAGSSGTVEVFDDDMDKGLVFLVPLGTGSVGMGEGSGTFYRVRLAAPPTGDVTVTVSGHPTGTNPRFTVDRTTLIFTPENWSEPQPVSVFANSDADIDDEEYRLLHTASGGGYDSVSKRLLAFVIDDDPEHRKTDTLELMFHPEHHSRTQRVTEGDAGTRSQSFYVRTDKPHAAELGFRLCFSAGATWDEDYRLRQRDGSDWADVSLTDGCFDSHIPANERHRELGIEVLGDVCPEAETEVVNIHLTERRDRPLPPPREIDDVHHTSGVYIRDDDRGKPVCTGVRSGSGPPVPDTQSVVTAAARSTAVPACVSDSLMATTEQYYETNRHKTPGYGANWFSVLVAFGERTPADWTTDSRTIEPMTAASSRERESRWHGWRPFTKALECVETAVSAQAPAQPATPSATPELSLSAGSAVDEGGNAGFTITADPAPQFDLAIAWTVAQSGDYLDAPGAGHRTVTLAAGAASVTLSVGTVDDAADEADGSVSVTLDAGTGYTLAAGQGSAVVTVRDDDEPVVSIAAGAGVTEGASASFTVTASPVPAAPLDVTLTIGQIGDFAASGEAGARTVTVPTSGSVTFEVVTADDATDEPGGSITATLAAGTGYTVAASPDNAASVKVADDDAAASGPTISIADATFREDQRTGYFTVTLSEPVDWPVYLHYATRDSTPVSARAGQDYYAYPRSWRLRHRFRRGEIELRLPIPIYDDSHDEGPETFEVVLFDADVNGSDGVSVSIADGVAVGTIVNDDPMPAAWLARFGRTVAEHALGGIAGRMAAPRSAGVDGALAGHLLGFGSAEGAGSGAGPGGLGAAHDATAPGGLFGPRDDDPGQWTRPGVGASADRFGIGGFGPDAGRFGIGAGWEEDAYGPGASHPLTLRDALLGSHFTATGERDANGGSLAFWGRAAQSSFDGREGTFSLDGEATTAMLGTDYARGDWLAGMALMQSGGEGGYRDTETGSRAASQLCTDAENGMDSQAREVLCDGAVREGDGTVEASLTAAVPYTSLQASERLKLWGALGHGTGEVTLKPAMGGSLTSDISWTMAAAGLRGDMIASPAEGSGPALAVTSDALWARTSSEKTHELAASDSDVTRLRLGLEGRWALTLEGGGHFTPKLEAGMRHDGGDAETGFGLELGGGLAWMDPTLGLSLDLSGRTLIAHGSDDLKDRGFAASFAFDPDPASERGLSLALRQEMGGQAAGGLDALFRAEPLEDRAGSGSASRWTAEAAYGFPAFSGRFTGSPHLELGLSTGARDYTLGWRLTPAEGAPDVSFGVRATRRESDAAPPEHTVGFEAIVRW